MNRGAAPPAPPPRLRLLRDLEREAGPGDLRMERLEVEVGRNLAGLERQDRLDQAGNASSRLEVADIALDRADQTGAAARRTPVDGSQGAGLGGIGLRAPDAMGLDVADRLRLDAARRQGRLDRAALCLVAGRRDGAACAGMVDGRAAHHGEDAIARGERVPEALQDDDPAAFPAHISVRARVERLRASVGGEHPCLRQSDRAARREHEADPAGQHEVGLAAPEAFASEVHRDQRGRTPAVESQAGTLQAEAV